VNVKEEEPMPKAPDPISLVLCERMHVDPQAGQMSLVGVFNSLRFQSFPAPMRRLTVYTALHGGDGQGTMKLTIFRADTEEEIYKGENWRGFAVPDLTTMYEGIVRDCLFPVPGRYIIELRFDGEIVTQRVLDVFQE
jgi:hypothetical protein